MHDPKNHDKNLPRANDNKIFKKINTPAQSLSTSMPKHRQTSQSYCGTGVMGVNDWVSYLLSCLGGV